MNLLDTILILLGVFLAVFWEAVFPGVRRLFGAQIDLLPPMMVYAALRARFGTVLLTAVFGGLWFDSLSANPLGVTVLPLLAAGVAIYVNRDLILRDETFARIVMGLLASIAVPGLTLLLLLTTARQPLFGWGTLWQFIVMGLGGALATPVVFELFDWLHRLLGPVRPTESSFRPDREIRRGR